MSKADMLRLLALAGFEQRHLIWQQVQEGDDLMLVDPKAIREMIDMARGTET